MKKILIVEDDDFLQKALGFTVREEGYEIVSAKDGEEALAFVKDNEIDLILLDLILPKMSGFDVLKQFKDDKETSNIPVIIVSNLGDKESVDKGLKMGADDYVIKAHFKLSDIIDKIKEVLDSKK